MTNVENIEFRDLTNIGFLKAQLDTSIIESLRDEISEIAKTGTKHNRQLNGHIRQEYLLTKAKTILEPILIDLAIKHNNKYNLTSRLNEDHLNTNFKFFLESVWVNFQKKHEFNPIHRHSGVYSFVIWVDVPYFFEFERNVGPGKESIFPKSGTFEFIYTDILGHISGELIPADKTYEGSLVLFPSRLHHCVFPFYSSDKTRISVAGNISTKPF